MSESGTGTGKRTGFAALEELAPDVSPSRTGTTRPSQKPAPVAQPDSSGGRAAPDPRREGPYQGGGSNNGGSKGWRIPVGVLLGIGAIVGFYQLNQTFAPSSQVPRSSFQSAPDSSWRPAPTPYTPPPPIAPSPPVESVPPVGSGLQLNRDQIRWCLSESIRLDAARGALNAYIGIDVERFNAMISFYNGRCANFQYRQSVMQSVTAEVEANRWTLQRDGAARFSR